MLLRTFATTIEANKTGARRVLGLLAMAWLNLALAPCAMALGAGPGPACPHCPPAASNAHDGHAMHADESMPCATAASDCLEVGESRVDNRAGQVKVKDVPGDQPLAILPAVAASGSPALVTIVARPSRAADPGGSRPLNVLYCVYLK